MSNFVTALHMTSIEDFSPIQRAYYQNDQQPNTPDHSTSSTPISVLSSIPFYSSRAIARNTVAPLHASNYRPTTPKIRKQTSLSFIRSSKAFNVSHLQRARLSTTSSTPLMEDENKFKITTSLQKSVASSVVPYAVVTSCDKSRINLSKLVAMIPLPIKLFFIVILSLVSLVAFGAILIDDSAKRVVETDSVRQLTIFSTNIAQIIHELQKERGASSLYLGARGNRFSIELEMQRNFTDLAAENWGSTKKSIGEFFNLLVEKDDVARNQTYSMIAEIDLHLLDLPAQREKVNSLQLNETKPVIDYFSNCIKHMIDVVHVTSSLAEDRKFLVMTNIFTLVMVLKESLGQRRGLGSNVLAAKSFTSELYFSFLDLRSKYQAIYQIIDSKSRNKECKHIFEDLSNYVKNTSAIDTMELHMLNSPFNLTMVEKTFSPESWFWTTTEKINQLKMVEDKIRDTIFSNGEDLKRTSMDALIGYSVGGFCVVVSSIILALIFSRTIQDLMNLYDETVHKFVPKEFMRIVHKDNVVDLKHGDYFEMELDVMFADIRGYTSICENMTPDETFEFLNNYLSLVGPVVREHGGYIDKYLGDGILALFLTPGQSVLAAMELQKRLISLNHSKKYPTVKVGVGIARGKCAVGLIGEAQRVDPTIIGDTVNLSSRLESLTKHYQVDIMVTREVIEASPLLEGSKYRNIGKIAVVGRQQACSIYEIITQSPNNESKELKKSATKEKFEAAIEMMYNRENFYPEESLEFLKQVVEEDEKDYVAQLRMYKLEEVLNAECIWNYEDRPDFK